MRNRAFVDEVAALVKGNKRTPLLVICAYGGTLESATDRKKRNPRLPAPIFGEFGGACGCGTHLQALADGPRASSVVAVAARNVCAATGGLHELDARGGRLFVVYVSAPADGQRRRVSDGCGILDFSSAGWRYTTRMPADELAVARTVVPGLISNFRFFEISSDNFLLLLHRHRYIIRWYAPSISRLLLCLCAYSSV